MCPNCRAFITSGDRTCPYCEQPVMARAIDIRDPSPILGLIPAARFTTVLILLINAGFFAATYWLSGSMGGNNVALWALGAKYGPSIWTEHQWWRLVTAGFLHGGVLHIAMNSWVLYDVGAQVEQLYGTSRFLVIYFVGTVAGF
ncbi:MAG: rhomboid family intramembrane serine protease [Terriglobia bacterium]